jgi:hypothetical protein
MEGIGTELHARTDFANLRGLLKDFDLFACLGKRKCCREATDTATGNQDRLIPLDRGKRTVHHCH